MPRLYRICSAKSIPVPKMANPQTLDFQGFAGLIFLLISENIIPTRCWASHPNEFCFRNMIPCSFDYLIYPYYPAYTMGCYQIVISGDNGIMVINNYSLNCYQSILLEHFPKYQLKLRVHLLMNLSYSSRNLF